MNLAFALKLIILGVSLALALCGVLLGKLKDKTGRLNRRGRIVLSLTIVGAALALTMEIVEAHKKKIEDKRQDAVTQQQLSRTEAQLLIAQQSLNQIEQIVTRFEEINVTACFEVPASGLDLYRLISPEGRRFASDRLGSYPVPFAPSRSVLHSYNVVGYENTSNSETLLYDGMADQALSISHYSNKNGDEFSVEDGNLVVPISLGVFEDLATELRSSQGESNKLSQFLCSPRSSVRIWRGDLPPSSISNSNAAFFAFSDATPSKIEFRYPTNRLRLTLTATFPRSNWWHNALIASLPDLAHASVQVAINDCSRKKEGLSSMLQPLTKLPPDLSLVALRFEINSVPIETKIRNPASGYAGFPGKQSYMPTNRMESFNRYLDDGSNQPFEVEEYGFEKLSPARAESLHRRRIWPK